MTVENSIHHNIDYIIYKGRIAQEVTSLLLDQLNGVDVDVEGFDYKNASGIDKQRTLLVYASRKNRGSNEFFINQGLKNATDFPYSIRINKFKRKFLRSLINQIKSDYFINFYRNIKEYGYPWGACERKYLKKDLLYKFSRSKNKLVRHFALFLKSLNPIFSSENNLLEVFKWVNKGQGEKLNIFIMICPDYDCFIDFFGRSIKYRFNNVLNCDIGLVAEKAIKVALKFDNFAFDNNLKINYIFGMADYEGTSENLKFLDETPESFYKKINQSNRRLKKKLNNLRINSRARVVMIRTFFGHEAWNKTFSSSAKQTREFFFKNKDFKKILSRRKKLYLKMGRNYNKEELIDRIVDHAREYYSVGELASRQVPNVLILGLSSINMETFYRLNSNIPVVYLSKTYE